MVSSKNHRVFPVIQWRGLTALSDNDLHFKIAVMALGAFSTVLAIRLIFF